MINKILKTGLFCLAVLSTGIVLGEGRNFIIEGKIPQLTSGKMLLLTETVNGIDTLAKAVIENGAFHMEGAIDQPLVALILVENHQGGFYFLLDTDAPYKLELYQDRESKIEGGALQKTLNNYQGIVRQANSEIKKLKAEIAEAMSRKHFQTKQDLDKKLAKAQEEARKELDAIIQKNKDNVFAAYIRTNGLGSEKRLEVLKSGYAPLTEKARKTPPGLILAARIAELEQVDILSVAPDFTLLTPEKEKMSLYGMKGKIKIIDFWASWCGPCRLENPNMVELYNEFKGKGLTIVSVSLDTKKEKWTEAIEKDGMPWIHLSSLKGWECEVAKQYGVDGVPSIFILDADNRILAKHLRGAKLREFIAKYLQ